MFAAREVIPFIIIYQQGCPTQSKVVKHSTSGWNSKPFAEQVIFKADFAAFWAKKEVVEPRVWDLNALHGNQTCLFIIRVGFNAHGPLQGHPRECCARSMRC